MTDVLSVFPWWAWIPIVAIVCGCISGVVKMRYNHLERIEMIRHGMSPAGGKPAGPPEV
jgi:hypothetical protein